jgi:hypothetical protein
MPANKNNRAPNWMKELRKKKKKVNEPSGIFSQGWLSVKNLDPLNKQVQKSLTKMTDAIEDDHEYDNLGQKMLCIANFQMELDMHNISQAEEALDIFPFSDMLQLVTT